MTPLTSYTCKLADAQATKLQRWLDENGYRSRTVPYARFAGEKEKTNVVFYESGKLVVQGKGTQEFVEFVLEPVILQEARIGYEAVLNPELLMPRLGVDESGKGDFFGPLCVAGAYINEAVIHRWQDAGIRDSKNISSDRRIAELARLIRETPGCVTAVVPIGPEAYNRLYAKMKSVNRLLAWGHARVIENLMQQQGRMNPKPVRAISDQFAHSKETVAKALMGLGRQIELVQTPQGRGRPVRGGRFHPGPPRIRHPAGPPWAGTSDSSFPRVPPRGWIRSPRSSSASTAPDTLAKVAKMHFRTALRAQGLPEPPRVEWKR